MILGLLLYLRVAVLIIEGSGKILMGFNFSRESKTQSLNKFKSE